MEKIESSSTESRDVAAQNKHPPDNCFNLCRCNLNAQIDECHFYCLTQMKKNHIDKLEQTALQKM